MLRCARALHSSQFFNSNSVSPLPRISRWQARCRVSFRGFQNGRSLSSKKKASSVPLTQRNIARNLPKSSSKSTSTEPFRPYVARLAAQSSPTLLYKASSHTVYKAGCYLFGGFCVSYAAFNIYDKLLFPLQEIPRWVKWAQGGICLGLLVFGAIFFQKPTRLISSITALPIEGKTIMLQIRYSSLLPGLGRRSISVEPQNITRNLPLHSPQLQLTREQKFEIAQQEERNREDARSKILTLPFRQASYWTFRGFKRLQNVFTDQEHIHLSVTGRRGPWKLNKDPIWAMEDGKVLDGLIKYKKF